jgi:hypothetical protein
MRFVFYSCFFGGNSNERNNIPKCPSTTHDCFFFTNNAITYSALEKTGWKGVYLGDRIPAKEDPVKSAMDAKHLKACPYMYKELQPYDATCYLDSSLTITSLADIIKTTDEILKYSNYWMLISRHPFISETWLPSARSEFNNAMLQPRYASERDKYEKYMAEQIDSGLLEIDDIHYATGFIIRKNCMETRKLGEIWYSHIQKCGIECQISFFFVQQMFKGGIYAIEPYCWFKHMFHN